MAYSVIAAVAPPVRIPRRVVAQSSRPEFLGAPNPAASGAFRERRPLSGLAPIPALVSIIRLSNIPLTREYISVGVK